MFYLCRIPRDNTFWWTIQPASITPNAFTVLIAPVQDGHTVGCTGFQGCSKPV